MEAGVWNVNPFDRRVPGGIRTPNLLIRSQLLYPVELQTLSKRDGYCRSIAAALQAKLPALGRRSIARFAQTAFFETQNR